MRKTIVSVDLAEYTKTADELENQTDSGAVVALEAQIQQLIDEGLQAVGISPTEAFKRTRGDEAILAFDTSEQVHRFARAFFAAAREHNAGRRIKAHRRFRMGAATGDLTASDSGPGGVTISWAVRLQSAAHVGQLLVDVATYDALPDKLKKLYGPEEKVQGKPHEEPIPVRRIVILSAGKESNRRILQWISVLCTIGFLTSIYYLLLEQHKNSQLRKELARGIQPGDVPNNQKFLSHYLRLKAPEVFYGLADANYDIARILPTNGYMRSHTNFRKELTETKTTFDMLANNAGVVSENWEPIIIDGLKRGVHYRLILSDYRESNSHFDVFENTVHKLNAVEARGSAAHLHSRLDRLITLLANDTKNHTHTYKGSLNVKWNKKFLLYTMWLRDVDTSEAVGHLGVHFYRGKAYWPNLRFSRNTTNSIFPPPREDDTQEFLELMKREFNELFVESMEYNVVRVPTN